MDWGDCPGFQLRQLDKTAFRLDVSAENRIGPQRFHHRDFIAALKLRTTQAVFPHLQRKLAPLHFPESHLPEEPGHISEGDQRVPLVLASFFLERICYEPSHSAGLDGGINR